MSGFYRSLWCYSYRKEECITDKKVNFNKSLIATSIFFVAVFSAQVQINHNNITTNNKVDTAIASNNKAEYDRNAWTTSKIHIKDSAIQSKQATTIHRQSINVLKPTIRTYLELNWLYDGKANNLRLAIKKPKAQKTKNVGDIRLGIDGSISNNIDIWGDPNSNFGIKNHKGYHGQLGIN